MVLTEVNEEYRRTKQKRKLMDRRVLVIVATLVIVGFLKATPIRSSYDATNFNTRESTNDKEAKEVLSPSPFFDEILNNLVSDWRSSRVSAESAKQTVWDIIQSPLYKNHHPNKGIVFIKTHKTGSSTITALLHSLATSHGLTAAISNQDGKLFKTKDKILNLPTTNPDHPNGAPYDVWSNHVVFDEILINEAVPTSEGKLFSIVRDPGTRIRSACRFNGCCPAKTSEEWTKFILNSTIDSFKKKKKFCELNQSFKEINGGAPSYKALIGLEHQVRQGNLLLMVTERFIESVLILRDFYDLHPLDIVFFPMKVMEHPIGSKNSDLITAEEKMREWNKYDTAIHKLANSTLSKKMEEIYPQQANRVRAVEEMETLNDLLHHVCSKELKNVVPELNSWCDEKTMDNIPWCRKHLKIHSNFNQ